MYVSACLSRPPGGEKEKHFVDGYSCFSMMAKMAAVPPPNEWPTQTWGHCFNF
jgi:hypothetical protein